MPKEKEIPRPAPPTRRKQISFSFLAKRIGRKNAEIIWRHLSPEGVRGDSETTTCYTVTETRRGFSGKMATQGVHLFAADRGKVPGQLTMLVSLDTLVSMLADASGKPFIVDALAASEELPAASPLTVGTGRGSELP